MQVLNASNVGAFYRFASNRLRNKTEISPLYDSSGQICVDDASKANLLNEYFSTVGTVDNGVSPSSGTQKLLQILFTEAAVTSAIAYVSLKAIYLVVLMDYRRCFSNVLAAVLLDL